MAKKKVERSPEEQLILDNILNCMNYKKISPTALCEYLGCNKQAVTNWKNLNNNSYLKHLHKIAEYLDVTPNDLMADPAIHTNDDGLTKQLLQWFNLCDMEGKLTIIQCASQEFKRTQKEKNENAEQVAVS